MIQIYRDIAGGWRFRVKGGNGEIVAQGEAYTRKADAQRGVDTLRRLVAHNETIDETIPEFENQPPYLYPALVPNTIWTYKGKSYRVLGISETDLIQFDEKWRPSVKYATEPDNMLRFHRADRDFIQKFERVGE